MCNPHKSPYSSKSSLHPNLVHPTSLKNLPLKKNLVKSYRKPENPRKSEMGCPWDFLCDVHLLKPSVHHHASPSGAGPSSSPAPPGIRPAKPPRRPRRACRACSPTSAHGEKTLAVFSRKKTKLEHLTSWNINIINVNIWCFLFFRCVLGVNFLRCSFCSF